MAKKKEMLAAVGKEVVGGASRILAQENKDPKKATERQQMVKRIIEEAVSKTQMLTFELSRATQWNTTPKYLASMGPLPPEMVEANGLPKLVKEFSGGGSYTIEIKSPGMESVFTSLDIDGEALPPITERNKTGAMPTTPAAAPGTTPTNGAAQGAYWAQMLGLPNPYQAAQQQQQQSENMMALVVASLLGKRGGGSEESEIVRQLKEQNDRLERRLENQERDKEFSALRAEMKADRDAADRRFEMILNKMEQGTKQGNPNAELIASVMPAITALIGDKNASAEAQGKFFEILTSQQQAASGERTEYLKMLQAQPKYEDRIAKLAESASNIMGTNVQAFGSLMSLMASMAPQPKGAGWEFLDKLAEQIPQVAGLMFEGDEEDGEESMQVGPAEVVEPGQMSGVDVRNRLIEEATQGSPEGREVVPPRGAFDDAVKKIFDLAENGGDTHEIAFRLFKHKEADFTIAKGWWAMPADASAFLFHTLRSRGEIDITDDRIREIAAEIQNLKDVIGEGEGQMERAEAYKEQYGIKISMPKPRVQQPPQSSVNIDGRNSDTFGETREEGPTKIKPPEPPGQVQPTQTEGKKSWVDEVVVSDADTGEPRSAAEWTKDVVAEEEDIAPVEPQKVVIIDGESDE